MDSRPTTPVLHDAAEGLKAWADTQVSRQLGYATWLPFAMSHFKSFCHCRSYAMADEDAVKAALRAKGFEVEFKPIERKFLVHGLMCCPPGE